jgi:predicted CopG family antitoxin
MKKTTIKISYKIKQELEKIKIHPRETYEDVITRLVKKMKK